MSTRRLLFTTLLTAIVGVGFSVAALSQPAQGTAGNTAGQHLLPSYYYANRYPQDNYSFQHPEGRYFNAGYPCTWAGSRDLAHGETAYQRGKYADAASLWQTAASKTCAVAAYKLGLIYFYGVNTSANQPLGAAWMSIAANSKYSLPSYASLSDTLTGKLDNAERIQAHADYARLRAKLGLTAE